MIELEKLDGDLRDASAWRERIRGPMVHIRDCNKDEILTIFDQLLRSARGFRAKLQEKESKDG
jgi:hypothetical protein